MWTLVTPDGVERESFDKFIAGFSRVRDYLQVGWRSVGLRNESTGEWDFVGSSVSGRADQERNETGDEYRYERSSSHRTYG